MSALTGLPYLEPAEAQLRSDLLAALNGIEAGGALLCATIRTLPPRVSWFTCRDALAFAIERLGGQPLHLRADDGVRAAECLEAAEPLLRAIEWALDVELEPETIGDGSPGAGSLWLCVETGDASDRIHLAIPRDMRLIVTPAPLAPQLIEDVPISAQLTLSGPRLAPMEAAQLAEGDVLLLGEAPLTGAIRFLDRPAIAGLFEPAARRFTPLSIQE
ncbi:hypothetical protein HNO88_002168 [Novosphingobium chloroacetimidivorans]|uniref:Flagellar motor switch protein FliN-like C-terminal domain-containing protein n=1 Tax=Novosphingobium chloroacetimidivorans TaxID=1428314 RepID=A0A7W7K9R9_9SPHN|nr:hypothetical protein [Novosphingobium chloroacetimidivorans]MBB4858842.1 hypothetical protein [Novosphingobium chloroacetimidivorans]